MALTQNDFGYGIELQGTFEVEESESRRGAGVKTRSNTIIGTLSFDQTGGRAKLLVVSDDYETVSLSGLQAFDKFLQRKDRTLTASTMIGRITLFNCSATGYSASSFSPGPEINVSFDLAWHQLDNEAERGDWIELDYPLRLDHVQVGRLGFTLDHCLDEPKANRPSVRIEVHRPSTLASSEGRSCIVELVSGSTYSSKSVEVHVRAQTVVRVRWTWHGEAGWWEQAREYIRRVGQALTPIAGYSPEIPCVSVVAGDSKNSRPIGKVLFFSPTGTGHSSTVHDARWLTSVSEQPRELVTVIAKWIDEWADDSRRFRDTVSLAAWSFTHAPPVEIGLINCVIALEYRASASLKRRHPKKRMDEKVHTLCKSEIWKLRSRALGFRKFHVVVKQAVLCRHYLVHGQLSAKEPVWNFDDPRVMSFLYRALEFLLYIMVLGECGWDWRAWIVDAKGCGDHTHRFVRFVNSYSANMKYADVPRSPEHLSRR